MKGHNMKRNIGVLVVLLAAMGAAAPAMAAPKQGKVTQITLADARARALKKVPGKVVEEETENENGRLIYSFDIRPTANPKTIKEVNIDAHDGTIVAVEDGDKGGE